MNSDNKKIELLAPAKDFECGKVAVDCGADAVYIGAPRFGARENASNDLDSIHSLIDYAHKFWAKVYITINTLLKDSELEDAVQMVEDVHSMGADAIIVQDTGLLECGLPPIPLIASTQMHNNTAERVAFWEKVGFKRAILARELSIKELKEIRKATNIELECFIHGALCVSYSGQCYMSYSLGARSGNRGQCAQPCRRAYNLVDAKGNTIARKKHLLSLKDLNLTSHLEELINAGISAFKIEGRLKDRNYVANVVSHYREQLDPIIARLGLQKSSSGESVPGFVPDVNKTFNRGYTDCFVTGRSAQKMASLDTPKMVGEYVGTVLSVKGRTIKLDRDTQIHPGDGICFYGLERELKGTVVNAVRGALVTVDKLHGIREHMQIFRNRDHKFLTSLESARPTRKIPVKITITDVADGLLAKVTDSDKVSAEYKIVCQLEEAQKTEQAIENIRKQISKTGDSDFICTNVDIRLSRPIFAPISVLNSLRRGLLEELAAAREHARPIDTGNILVNNEPFPAKELTFEGNVLNTKAVAFYRRHGVSKIEPAAESGTDLLGRRVMRNRYCIKHQLDMCPKFGAQSSAESLFLLDPDGNRFRLEFDCAECEMEIVLENRADG